MTMNEPSIRTEDGPDSGTQQRLRNAEAAIDVLRTTTKDLEREIALMRADLERLRQEAEKAAGSKLP
jgi:multidrug resistance efflux pump